MPCPYRLEWVRNLRLAERNVCTLFQVFSFLQRQIDMY